jgi:origin recognition complex subunit 5
LPFALQVPQRLLGPSPFPLDRLIALLGALLEEHDVESRLPAPEFTIPGEYTDMETSRVAINAAVSVKSLPKERLLTPYLKVQELSSSRLMHRTTKAEQIDGPAMFKCAISYDLALALSKELKIPLPELLWEQV